MPRKNNRLTREYCEEAARTCSSLKELCVKHRSVAIKAFKEGWIDDYTWLARQRAKRNSLSEEVCARIAREYATLHDFRHGNPSAYVTSVRKGWLHNFHWLVREMRCKTYHDKDELVTLSMKFSTNQEFRVAFPNEYHYAWEHGWLKDFKWLTKAKRGPKSKEENYG